MKTRKNDERFIFLQGFDVKKDLDLERGNFPGVERTPSPTKE